MGEVLSSEQMDNLRSKILGISVVRSAGPDEAAERLRYILELRHGHGSGILGNSTGKNSSRLELIRLNYTRGHHQVRDKLYDRLTPQAKTIMEILAEDGRMVWAEHVVRSMMEDNQSRFNTNRPCLEVYHFYRKRLIDANYLKKLSYSEFLRADA
jgi:hypothetical protein